MKRASAFALALLLAAVAHVRAQSLFATRGLGVPVPPVDARARALGGIGLGLLGLNMSFVNPAEVAGVTRRGVSAALQPGSASPELAGESDNISASRFPLIRFIYPFSSRLTATLGYGSFLEQSWAVQLEGTEQIGSETVPTRDVIQSTGGIARVGLGLAWQVTPALAIGGTAGLLTGNLDRRITRSFGGDSATSLLPFETRLRWDFDGAYFTGGFRVDAGGVARASASLTVMQNLEIDGVEAGARDDRAELPMRLSMGASGILSNTLLAAAGAEWTRGATGAVFEAIDAAAQQRDTWRVGGGFEYDGIRSRTKSYPLRLGASWAQLPYYNLGETPASEWSGSLGIGFRLAGDEAGPLAVADIAIERGSRSGLESTQLPAGLKESFWRLTFSLSLFGN
jgi:hypothetical protein